MVGLYSLSLESRAMSGEAVIEIKINPEDFWV
jgi:hypothetical protein